MNTTEEEIEIIKTSIQNIHLVLFTINEELEKIKKRLK